MPQPADDHPPHRAAVALGALESAQRRLDRLAERQPAAHVEHRRVAHLDVPHAVASRVDRQLVRDALERLGRLHHAERHVEAREVVLETARVVDAHELAQRIGVVARHRLTCTRAPSSSSVSGRTEPSRWQCSSALGRRRSSSE